MKLTDEQVDAFNAHQMNEMFHPYTCLNDGDEKHILYEFAKKKTNLSYEDYIKGEKERGVPFPHMEFTETSLIATKDGWICPVCDYKQKITI